MSIAGFVVLIWRSSASFEKFNNKFDKIDTQIEILIRDIEKTKAHQSVLNDNMMLILIKQDELNHNQRVLSKSYTDHLAKDKRFEELIAYLKSFKFEVKKAMSDSIQFNILIRKIK